MKQTKKKKEKRKERKEKNKRNITNITHTKTKNVDKTKRKNKIFFLATQYAY